MLENQVGNLQEKYEELEKEYKKVLKREEVNHSIYQEASIKKMELQSELL